MSRHNANCSLQQRAASAMSERPSTGTSASGAGRPDRRVLRLLARVQARGQALDAASQLALWKNAIDCRRPLGTSTRCIVERQRSLVQRAIASPRLTTNEPGAGARRATRPVGPDLQPALDRVGEQDGQRAVVGVRAGAQLAGERTFVGG